MVLDDLEADPGARRGTFRRIGDQLGVNPETLRSWVNRLSRCRLGGVLLLAHPDSQSLFAQP